MTGFLSDIRFTLRTLARSPLFTAIAVLSLALGIGANTAIFTLLDQLMLRVLPVKEPQQLVQIVSQGEHWGSGVGRNTLSYPMYQDFQRRAPAFRDVFCRYTTASTIAIDGAAERVQLELVSGNYFNALGVGPAAGRVFNSSEDDRVYNGHPHVVLSHDYWAARFNGDRDVVGKKVLVNNHPMTIIGVSAAGFRGMDPAQSPQIRVPIQMQKQTTMTWMNIGDRRLRWVNVFARLKPGETAASAQASLLPLFKSIIADEVKLEAFRDASQYARNRFLEMTTRVAPAAAGYSNMREQISTALIVLMCMVGLVLLIACANVANLLVARATARQKEMAVRLSIGASRGQLIRQLLLESVMLSTAGGVLGIALATWTTRLLLQFIPKGTAPLMLSADPDLRVLGFSFALSLVTGIVFGLLPALQSTRLDLWSALKGAAGSIAGSGGSVRLRKTLVAAQVSLSILLLIGAGLFIRSLQNLRTTDSGFDLENLIHFRVDIGQSGYQGPRQVRFFRTLLDNLRAAPGVKSAAISRVHVLDGDGWTSTMSAEGYRSKDGEDMAAHMNSVSPDYFKAMGVELLEGRDFSLRDVEGQPRVAVVNRKFARHFFGDKSAVGRKIGNGLPPTVNYNREIIGVVDDARYEDLRTEVHRQVFTPAFQGEPDSMAVYVRGSIDSAALFGIARREVAKMDANIPVFRMITMQEQLDNSLLVERVIASLSAVFGGLATLLASIGLYGVMAFVVTRRTKEIGVRIALGAQRGSVVWLVMREVMALVAIGLALGVPTALLLGRYISAQLYGVNSRDPLTYGVSIIILLAVAALAGFIPARRASRVDPILALRYD